MSHDEPQPSRSERELEAMFATLKPAESSLTAAEIAFEAGRRAGRMQLLRWRAAAAILVGALGLSLLARPAPRTVERVVVAPPAARDVRVQVATDARPYAVASPAPAPGAYLNLRQAVVERGLDALPNGGSPSGSQGDVLRAGSSLDELRGRL